RRDPRARGCYDCQRHRAAAPGRRAGPADGRSVYLHEHHGKWTLRADLWGRRNAGVVSGKLSHALFAAGVYGRANAGAALAGSGRGFGAMAPSQPFRLILASGSPARRELLERAGYSFEVLPADIDEPTGEEFPDPRTLVQHTAWLKAAAVAPRVSAGIV